MVAVGWRAVTDMTPRLRWAGPADDAALADVMYDAVRNGPSAYTEAQRQQWVPERRSGPEWTERLASQSVIVAEHADEIVGFMSLADGGYIDFAYVRPWAQGTGVFRRMYDEIERCGQANGLAKLWVHASERARPAFAAVGFVVIEKQVVTIGGELFERFKMEFDAAR